MADNSFYTTILSSLSESSFHPASRLQSEALFALGIEARVLVDRFRRCFCAIKNFGQLSTGSKKEGDAYVPVLRYRISEVYCSERLLDRIKWNWASLCRSLPLLSIAAEPHLTILNHGARRRFLWLLTLYRVSRSRTSSEPQPVPNCGASSASENQFFVKVKR